jgi:hypothetical protein
MHLPSGPTHGALPCISHGPLGLDWQAASKAAESAVAANRIRMHIS